MTGISERTDQKKEPFRILMLGDLHFGENYSTGGRRLLRERGYDHATVYLSRFTRAADVVVANFESPIVDRQTLKSPFIGKKRFIHWADPDQAPHALKRLGVDAVSLANNHAVDYGHDGLTSTISAMEGSGIQTFGVGETIASAARPLKIDIPLSRGGGSPRRRQLRCSPPLRRPRKPVSLLWTLETSPRQEKEDLASLTWRSPTGVTTTGGPVPINAHSPAASSKPGTI